MANLSKLERKSPEAVLSLIRSDDASVSKNAGLRLVASAKDSGLSMKDYLTYAIDPRKSENAGQFSGLNGFEATLAYLNLPFKDDFEQGVLLQAASDNFQTYPGTRAMFPEVIDTMLRWKNRQDQIETTTGMVSQSRTISGTELISTAVEDDSKDRDTFSIAEFGRIPVRTIRTSQTSVGIFKHGSGIRTSYEFERRSNIQMLVPYAVRVARELELSKVKVATGTLLNGDGVNAAAPVTTITSLGGSTTESFSTQYKVLAKWLINRAKLGLPIDTVMGNLDMYLELLFMFTPTLAGNRSEIEAMVAKGAPGVNVNIPLLGGQANFVLSSSMPAGKVLGFSKGDTLEELVEAGSSIAENEKSIENQAVTYVRTENTGYKLIYGDTRSVLNIAA